MAVEFAGAEEMPQAFFGACGLLAKGAGEVALVLVAVHGGSFTPSLTLPARGREPDVQTQFNAKR
jgi:hypothetical protein